MRRYKIFWKGPWDGAARSERILTMRAKNQKQALALHKARYPCQSIRVEHLGRV